MAHLVWCLCIRCPEVNTNYQTVLDFVVTVSHAEVFENIGQARSGRHCSRRRKKTECDVVLLR